LTQQELFNVFVKSVKVRLFGTFGNLWGKGLDSVNFECDELLSEEFEELIFIRAFGELGQEYKLYKRSPLAWMKYIKSYKNPIMITKIKGGKFDLRLDNKRW